MSNPPEPCPCFTNDMFPSDSQLRSFHDSLHGESRICCLRHHRENGNSNTATKQYDKQLNHIRTTRNTYSDPSRIQINIPKTLETLMNVTWLQRLVFPRHNHKKAVSFSRTPDQPFCTHCKILVKSEEMSSEPRAEMKPAILSTNANLGRFIGYGEWTSSWTKSAILSTIQILDSRQNNPLPGWNN